MSNSDGGDDSDYDLDEMMYLMSAGSAGDADLDNADDDEDEPIGEWNFIREFETSIEIDLVDRHLLEVARQEVPIVLNRLKSKMFGGRVRNLCKVAPARFLEAWMDATLLGHVKQFINKNLSRDSVSNSEILAFIRIELMLSFYRVSPSLYFDMDERANFPSAGQGMDLIRYRQILKALSRSGTSRQESALTWTTPMQHDREMAAAMEIVRATGSELAFVAGVTQVGLDDDLLRMRSKRVIDHGFSQINNPCKGLGVIHHGAVSVVTGLYIGGHVAARGESTLDCVKILQRSMTGVSSESQIRLDGNTFFWDRGYGGVNGEVNQWSVSVGATLLGTAKRMRSFPFTYDQHLGPDRQLIAEKGASAHYWAKKTIRNGSIATHQYALASRNGLGRVVLMQTTEDRYGPGKFTLVTRQRGCDTVPEPTDDEVIQLFEEEHVEQLTYTQRSPEWFNQRQFRITGTSALALWKRYAHRARCAAGATGGELSHNIMSTCKVLGLKFSNEVIPNEAVADRIYSRLELVGLSVAHLKHICRQKSLPVTGSKTILIERVLSWGGSDQSNGECPILELLLEKWFMSPFASSTSMREGTLNESNVLQRLAQFLEDESDFNVTHIREYGLLCAKGMFYAAFSPDAIAVAENDEMFEEPTPFLVEIKSKCTPATVMKETELARTYGTCPLVYVDLTDAMRDDDFKQMIPEPEHRCQLLHGVACGDLRHAFYVVASLHKIIRVVHVMVDFQVVERYRSALQEVHDRELSWVLHGRLPCLGGMKLRHAVDEYTVQKQLELWRAIYSLVKTRGRPLPAGRMLIPTIIAMWNRSKGPVDVFSRFMKNCHARHAQLSPLAHIWLRLLMSRVYNAYQSYILSRSAVFLLSDECKSYAAFQANRKLYGSFAKFCSSLAKDLTLEVSGDDSSDSSEGDYGGNNTDAGEGSVLNTSGMSVTYNKRDMYFRNREMIQRRLDQSLPHVLCKVESKPTSCVWCCRKRHDQPDPKHCRHGRTTKFRCPVCMVSLCRVKRFDGRSCHELFHTSRSLVDYCTAEMDAVVHVVPHRNRPPPPNRGRINPDDSSDEEEPPRSVRSRITPVVTRRVRRSLRQPRRAPNRRV